MTSLGRMRAGLLLTSAVTIFLFQNCQNDLKSFEGSQILASSELPVVTEPTPVIQTPAPTYANYRTRAATEPGDGSSANFNGQIGVYTWGGYLDPAHNQGKPLLSSASLVANSGFKTIRIGMSGDVVPDNQYKSPNYGNPQKLTDLLSFHEIRDTLLMSAFPVVAITLYDFTSIYQVTHLPFFSQVENQEKVFTEYFEFYSAMFRLPSNTLKTFVILNWEGDNQLYPSETIVSTVVNGVATNTKVPVCSNLAAFARTPQWFTTCNANMIKYLGQSTNDAIDAFTIYHMIRKAALLAARDRKPTHSLIEIKYGMEINQVGLIDPALGRSMISSLVPIVKPDIVTDSYYQSTYRPSAAREFQQIRLLLDSYGLAKTKIGIGEFGQAGTIDQKRAYLSAGLKEVSTDFPELAFGFIWNAFNGEVLSKDDTSLEAFGLWQPNGELFVAPTTGILSPVLNTVSEIDGSCFAGNSVCPKPISGNFPLYSLAMPSAQLKCSSGKSSSLQEVSVLAVKAQTEVTLGIPNSVRGQSCRTRIRSDLGIPSNWSDPFRVH